MPPAKNDPMSEVVSKVLTALDGVEFGDEPIRVTFDKAPPPVSEETESVLKREIPVIKTNEERYVLGIVLEPGVVDSQNDTYTATTVRAAAYKFMQEYGNLGLQHQKYINGRVKILENWVTRDDCVVEGQVVKAGTWLLGVRVVDDALWTEVKSGAITGFSIGGYAARTPVT